MMRHQRTTIGIATRTGRLPCGLLAVAIAGCVWSPAVALIVVNQSGTTAPPADDPGWDYVTQIGTNYTYLGDRWVLSARHVGVYSATFPNGSFSPVPGENFIVRNPADSGLTTETDLRLIRIDGDPGLPSIFEPGAPFTISTGPLPFDSGDSVVVILGNGRSRQPNQTHWSVVKNGTDWTWNEVPAACGGANCYSGYRTVTPEDDTKRWGTNTLANANNYSGSGAFSQIFPALPGETIPTRGVLPLRTADTITRDVVSMISSFSPAGQTGLSTNEAQAVGGDSGSAVFFNRDGQWELVGIVNAVLTYEDQPGSTAVYGNATTFADLSYYNQPYYRSICDVMKRCGDYSVQGDVNLDGEVFGNGTGPWASDDVTAFVQGWKYNNGAGRGDYDSWTKGDLNLDGRTDVRDFFLLRTALQSAGSSAGVSSLSAILNGAEGAVPEPAAASLALVGIVLLALRRPARRGTPIDSRTA